MKAYLNQQILFKAERMPFIKVSVFLYQKGPYSMPILRSYYSSIENFSNSVRQGWFRSRKISEIRGLQQAGGHIWLLIFDDLIIWLSTISIKEVLGREKGASVVLLMENMGIAIWVQEICSERKWGRGQSGGWGCMISWTKENSCQM